MALESRKDSPPKTQLPTGFWEGAIRRLDTLREVGRWLTVQQARPKKVNRTLPPTRWF